MQYLLRRDGIPGLQGRMQASPPRVDASIAPCIEHE